MASPGMSVALAVVLGTTAWLADYRPDPLMASPGMRAPLLMASPGMRPPRSTGASLDRGTLWVPLGASLGLNRCQFGPGVGCHGAKVGSRALGMAEKEGSATQTDRDRQTEKHFLRSSSFCT